MTSNHRTKGRVRQWSGCAVLAAAVAMIGTGIARADTIDELLMQSEGDFTQSASLYAGIDPALLSAHQAADQAGAVSALEGLAGLTSTLQSHQDALPEALQTSSQLLGPDQQLATASGDLLSAINTFANAADAGDFATGQATTLTGDVTGYFAKLDVLYAELFQVLPAELNAGLLNAGFATEFATFPNIIDPVSPAAAVTDPATLLSEATTNYTAANQLLAEIPSGQLASVSDAIFHQGIDLQDIASVGSAESALSSYNNGVLADLLNPWFTSVDQGWDQASQAALNADQALESAVASGSATDINTALFGLIEPTYQAFGPDLQSNFIDVGAQVLTGVDPSSAGLDSASAIDPGISAGLLSSIGL